MSKSVEPHDVAQMVEEYVESELRDAEKYTNRQPLDGTGVYSLHDLAARIYARGWGAGHTTGYDAATRAHSREVEAARSAITTTEEAGA